jgi:hypothetical protein
LKSPPNPLIRKYSSSALIAYAIAMLLFTLLAIIGDNSNIERVATAIGTGGFFIVAGDLLSSPYPFSVERYKLYDDLHKLCETLCAVTSLDNHYVNGDKAHRWIVSNINEAVQEKENCLRKHRRERVAFYFGVASSTIGFASLLLVRDSDIIDSCWLNESGSINTTSITPTHEIRKLNELQKFI